MLFKVTASIFLEIIGWSPTGDVFRFNFQKQSTGVVLSKRCSVLKDFAIFTEKHCAGVSVNRPITSNSFPANITKFLRTTFSIDHFSGAQQGGRVVVLSCPL